MRLPPPQGTTGARTGVSAITHFEFEAPQRFTGASPELTALVASHDWLHTPLGDRHSWSPHLRTALEITLASRFPIVVWWGPDYTQIYNDPYRPFLGTKHPAALGQSARDCWAEIWPIIGPQIDSVFSGGPATWNESLLLAINRFGYPEETYFTFSYSALPEERSANGIGGVLATVQDMTREVIGARRMRLLRDLAAYGTAHSVDQACKLAVETMARYDKSIPFASIYLRDGDSIRLAASDLPPGLEGNWPLQSVALGSFRCIEPIDRILRVVPPGPWPERPTQACIVPLPSNLPGEPAGYLVAGVNARRRFDEDCADFLRLTAAQIGASIASARAYEEERKRAEALAELDRAKNLFFSNVSHEFRTPLTLMLGPLEELAKDADDRTKPMVAAAQRNALRLLKLVNTLLEYARLEAGRVEATYAPTDLSCLTADLCSAFRSAIESAGLRFEVTMELRELVYVDRSMWEKIVLNLLSNALKFTLRGEIAVRLQRRDGHAELTVQDTGSGIAPEELPLLFERFRRVRGAVARSHEGSGIGLALAKELTELHGGEIAVESQPGLGSRFIVRIPLGSAHVDQRNVTHESEATRAASEIVQQYLAEVEGTLALSQPSAAPERAMRAGKPRLLLADDNADLRAYVQRLLDPHYDVVAVRDGLEALAALREQSFDVVLSDAMMPGMDGFQLLAAVRADPVLGAMPFVMLSARAGEEATLEGRQRGADDYLVKPFTADDLIARLAVQVQRAHRAELAARPARELRALAQSVPAVVWSADASGAVDWFNQRWCEYTGRTLENSVGWAWQAAIHPDDLNELLARWSLSIQYGAPFECEARLRRANGLYGAVIVRAEPVRDERGAVARWYGTTVDIAAQRSELRRSQRIAQTLQSVFLPSVLPHVKQLRADAVYHAAGREAFVGGDWYDAVELPDGRYLFSIGDVTGHGLEASVTAGRLRQAIFDFSLERDDPSAVLRETNRLLRFVSPGIYASALVAFCDAACEHLVYANAGHPPPLLARASGECVELPVDGLLLGVQDDPGASVHRTQLSKGALLALFTDGLLEFAREPAQAHARLCEALAQMAKTGVPAHPARALRDAVLHGASTSDDAAVLVLQFDEVTTERSTFDPAQMEHAWRFHSSDAASASRAREQVMQFIRRYARPGEDLFAAELIVGEILANTVEHAPGLVEMTVDWRDERPAISVSDTGPGLGVFEAGLPGDALSENGRGLFLIGALSPQVTLLPARGFGTEMRVVLPVVRTGPVAPTAAG